MSMVSEYRAEITTLLLKVDNEDLLDLIWQILFKHVRSNERKEVSTHDKKRA